MRHLKKVVWMLSAGTLLLSSCGKEKESCSQRIYDVPAYVAFVGVPDSVLKTVIVTRFAAGSFSDIKGIDTILTPTPFHIGDTTYHSDSLRPFFSVTQGSNYEIALPIASRSFRLEQLVYHGDSLLHWTEFRCRGRTFTRTADAVTIDGQEIVPFVVSINTAYLFLTN